MKICMVNRDKVRIPRPPMLQWDDMDDPSLTPIDIQSDTLTLEPRELNGITRMVAYDRETDTLFVKEPKQ
jgi:hypothetical protein